MFKFKISDISDGLFVLISSFTISFVLSYFFLKNSTLAIIVSIAFCFAVFGLFEIIRKKKKGKLSIKREDEEKFIKCVNAMCLLDNHKAEQIIFETLFRHEKKPIKVTNGIVCQETFFYCKFSYDKITISDVVNAFKKTP